MRMFMLKTRFWLPLTTLIWLATSLSCDAASPTIPSNAPSLPQWTSQDIDRQCRDFLAMQHTEYRKLAQMPLESVQSQTFIPAWNALHAAEEDISGIIGLLSNTSPQADVREAAERCELKLTGASLDVLQDTDLFLRLKHLSQHASPDPIEARWKTQMLRQFEEAGSHLNENERAELKKISTEVDALTQAFERALRENNTLLFFTEQELAGTPENFLKKQPRHQDGRIQIGLSYPEYEAVMGHAESEAVRKKLYLNFTQRGGEENLKRLNRVTALRHQFARLLGVRHYAEWALKDHMANNADTVHHFLNQVADAVEPIEARDRHVLQQLKNEHLKQARTVLNRWDILFYENRLKQQRYAIDQNKLRKHFPPEASVAWMFFLAEHLYQIQFTARETPEAWYSEVKSYAVVDTLTKETLGTLYLDLYPRLNKFSHAAAFSVRSRSTLLQRRPISVLVTNLNREGLTHDELETLLHEFGHTLHGLLSETRYILHAGTRVERDFVEAPSQMFEEWARHKESLQYLPRFCSPACPALTDKELDKLNTARKLNKGITYARQYLYAQYDMALTEGLPPCTDAFQYWKQLESETPWGYLEKSQFPSTFGHLMGGYAAGYYGYMWSEVLALDMTTPFQGHWLDSKIGQHYRRTLLSQGGQYPASVLVKNFLGRAPNPKIFFQEITGKR